MTKLQFTPKNQSSLIKLDANGKPILNTTKPAVQFQKKPTTPAKNYKNNLV